MAVFGTRRGDAGEAEMASRTAARSPPPTRAGGQDDGSYTNSLKKYVSTAPVPDLGPWGAADAYFIK